MFTHKLSRAGGRLTFHHRIEALATIGSSSTPLNRTPSFLAKYQNTGTRLLQRRSLISQARSSSPKHSLPNHISSIKLQSQPSSWQPLLSFNKSGIRYSSTALPQQIAQKTGSSIRTVISLLVVAAVSFSAGSYFVMASIGAQVLPKYTDAESAVAFQSQHEHQQEVEDYLNNHALIQTLRSKAEFTESRPHLKFSEAQRASSLTAGVLSGPGKIVVPPIVFLQEKGESMVMVTYLGTEICGYPGFVHGGLLATLLDEGLARCAFQALPNKLGMTASLQINYKKPTLAGQYVVLRAKVVKSEGRKAWVEGHIETLPKTDAEEPIVLVDASGLFIEPKQIKLLSLVTGPVDA